MRSYIILFCLIAISCSSRKESIIIDNFQSHLKKAPVNGGFKMDDYWVWCGSSIKGNDGKYHLFASRWPKKYPFMEGYVFYSEVVHALSDKPEGPYVFHDVALSQRGEEYWDGRMTHNPSIIKYKDTYYLYYIGSTFEGEGPSVDSLKNIKHIYQTTSYKNIKIGVAKSKSLYGPWERKSPIIEPQPHGFDSVVTTNPAPCLMDNGEVYLVYRTFIRGGIGHRLGITKAAHPDSAYNRVIQEPIATAQVEDPFIWQTKGKFYIIAKDMTGEITGEKHAGVFLIANDLTKWSLGKNPKAYSRKVFWDNGDITTQGSLERPHLLIEDGIPKFLFAATADGSGGFTNANNTWNMVIPIDFDK
jgi:hypothetical protein